MVCRSPFIRGPGQTGGKSSMYDMEGLTAKEAIRKIQAEYMDDALKANKDGRKVAWVTSIAPREILEAMDVITVYPENHCAGIAARKGSLELLEVAESNGYSNDICSYARVNLGYVEVGDSAAGQLPKPDLLMCCNNICNTVTKWYEILARRLNVPLIMIDLPFSYNPAPEGHALRYITGQIEYAKRQLEDICGQPFDEDKFLKSQELSNEAASLWRDVINMGKAKPSPLNGLDMFNYMAQIVCSRGNQVAVDFFTLLKNELQEKKERGEGYLENEEHRILWDGIPFWFNLRLMSRSLKEQNACMAASTYNDNWAVNYEVGNLESMAKAYMGNFTNREFGFRYKNMLRLIEEFDIDGVIMHSNRSCKNQDFVQYALAKEVTKAVGTPVVIVDGDQDDPRAFSAAQYETRVQALFEMIEQNKK